MIMTIHRKRRQEHQGTYDQQYELDLERFWVGLEGIN